jgi:hypothetical protein
MSVQKRHGLLDVYAFITITWSIPLLVDYYSEGIISPVVSVLVLTWFIRYVCFYYYHFVLLVPEGIFHPNSPPTEVSAR